MFPHVFVLVIGETFESLGKIIEDGAADDVLVLVENGDAEVGTFEKS